MLNKYRHISFDLDGTLVHTTLEYRHEIVPVIVKELGGTIKNPYLIDKFWFGPNRDEIIKNNFNLEPSRFWPLFRKVDSVQKRSAHTRAYDDAERALKKLKEINKIISIITNVQPQIAQMEIGKLNSAPHDFYLSLDDSEFNAKPSPESFHYVLENLKIKPEETIYIGNSNEDAYYAKNAGVDFIYLERKEHQFDLGNYAIASIRSLDELFKSKL